MGIFNWFKRSRSVPSSGMTPYVFDGNFTIPDLSITPEMAMKNSDVAAAVGKISGDVAFCKFNAPETYKKVLNKPNELIGSFTFWQSVTADMLLTGNGYVLIWKNGNNVPDHLEYCSPDNVMVYVSNDGQHLNYQINFNDQRQTIVVPAENMLHFKLLSFGNNNMQYVGRSPLNSLQPELNIIRNANKLATGSIKHLLASTYVLQANDGLLKPEQRENVRKEFERHTEGDNAGRTVVLDQAISLSTLNGDAPATAKLLQALDWSRDQVAKAFNIPSSALNGKGDEQSSIEMTRKLYNDALRLYTSPIEAELTLKLGVDVSLNMDKAVDPNGDDAVNQAANLVKNGVLNSEEGKKYLQRRGVNL